MGENHMRLSDTENTIINAMARAFFVTAWADRQEERGRSFSGQELMDVAPKTPRFAREFALMFAGQFPSLLVCLNNAAWADVMEAENLTDKEVPYRFKRPDLEAKAEELKTDEYTTDFGH